MTQDTSWTDIRGVPDSPGLVAQVFFATDSDTLDPQDTGVLGRLAQEYQIPLLGNRIELMCIGNADRCGGAGYNLALGNAVRKRCNGSSLSAWVVPTSSPARERSATASGMRPRTIPATRAWPRTAA
jgi:hypothetical protein